ncbi:hypothetical protein DID76_02875 [Candidatus Marinamargulisbacteria bacterium SCGC AG-414-C22]|nr:hypothetical protein DID76_02875 [Candidatus Marinamargulisbacteria bacterium SCGC AG-414-C22]
MIINFKIVSVAVPKQSLSKCDNAYIGVYSLLSLYASAFGWFTMEGKSSKYIVSVTTLSWLLLAGLPGNRKSFNKVFQRKPLEQPDKAKLVNLMVAFFACSGVGFTLANNLSLTAASYGLQSVSIASKRLTENMPVAIAGVIVASSYGIFQFKNNPEFTDQDKLDNFIVACQISNMINLMDELYTVTMNKNDIFSEPLKHGLQCLYAGIFSFNVFAVATNNPVFNDDIFNDANLTIASLLVLCAIVQLEYYESTVGGDEEKGRGEREPLLNSNIV